MTETRFYAHEGHIIAAEGSGYDSFVAYEGYPRPGWSGGRSFALTDVAMQVLVDDQNAQWSRETAVTAITLAFDPSLGVVAEHSDGSIDVYGRDDDGLIRAPGWSWGEVDPTLVQYVKLLDGSVVAGADYVRTSPKADVTDADRLAYLRKRLTFWIANLDANAATYEADGLDDTARRLRLDYAQLDDILARIDGREDAYIASLKREGSL